MSRILSKGTAPERLVRSMVTGLGFRYRLHRRDLPGTPDLVFPGLKKVIFVNGCFWHQHGGVCKRSYTPKTNTEYWEDKFRRNKIRDRRARKELKNLGWQSLVIWECQLSATALAIEKIRRFLRR